MLNQRIEYQSFYGTIKYIGPLLHTESPSDEIWLGIEWDDPTRGKHNGIVNETEYFKTKNETGGSLIKKEKVNFGLNVLKAILSKYFREDPEELYKQMEEMINNQENQMAIEENKENIEAITKQEAKQVLIEKNSTNEKVREVPTVEYDDEAYFETIKKHKKKVEFVGFDKIWKKINNLHEIQELSLPSLYISDIGPSGFLRRLTPNLKVLSLEKNLIFSWDQIFQIGHELPNLESLSISENKLNELENDVLYKENIRVLSAQTPNILINSKPVEAFKNLKTLILLDMGLNWKELNKVKAAFDKVEELILCRNELNDFENLEIDKNNFPNLKFINIEQNNISSFDGIKKFGCLASLEKLTVSKNNISKIGKIEGFPKLSIFSIEMNNFTDCMILNELAQFKKLNNLRLKENPFINIFSSSYIRQRAVAEIENLQVINGSILKKYERKDCEIFYLRKTFDDFFKFSLTDHNSYDLPAFLKFCDELHPRIHHLMKVYGNPYEKIEETPNNQIPTNEVSIAQQNKSNLTLLLSALAGSELGKKPVVRKFPFTTTIHNLKIIFSKIFGIPGDKQIIWYKGIGKKVMEPMEEDQKSLIFYSVENGGRIYVDEKHE